MDEDAFTTATTPASMRASAATRSRSEWSITAISPGSSRWTRFLVRRSTRHRPTTSVTSGSWMAIGTCPLGSRCFQQLGGMAPGGAAVGLPRQHARQLACPSVALYDDGGGPGTAPCRFLGHRHLMVGERRHLG